MVSHRVRSVPTNRNENIFFIIVLKQGIDEKLDGLPTKSQEGDKEASKPLNNTRIPSELFVRVAKIRRYHFSSVGMPTHIMRSGEGVTPVEVLSTFLDLPFVIC